MITQVSENKVLMNVWWYRGESGGEGCLRMMINDESDGVCEFSKVCVQ